MIDLSREAVEKLLRRLREAEETFEALVAGGAKTVVSRDGARPPGPGAAMRALRAARSEPENALAREGKERDETSRSLRQAVRAGARARAFIGAPSPDAAHTFRMRRRDGSSRHILAGGSLDAAPERLQLLPERMTFACLVTSPDGTTREWNPAAERLFGGSRAEAVGRNAVEILVPAESRSWLEGFLARLAASRQSKGVVGGGAAFWFRLEAGAR